MKDFFVYALLVAAGATAAPSSNKSYAKWMTDSVIGRGIPKPGFHYSHATIHSGLQRYYETTHSQAVYDFYKDQIDQLVLDNGTIDSFPYAKYSLDNYRYGNSLLWWYEKTGETKYKLAADGIKGMLDKHPRTPTGGFWHRDPTYPNQMWLDGIYMADTFYAKYVSLFQPNNQTAWNDIALQFDNIHNRTLKANGLLLHGYDESKTAVWADPVTGAAPLVWARADGWYFMALLEVWALFPKNHPARARIVEYFTTQANGLKNSQDELGGWWNIMDKQYEDVDGNYLESSASAMFAFGFLKGLNLGILKKSEYAKPAKKAYKALIDLWVSENNNGTINWEGTVEVGSLGSNATFEYYSSIGLVKNDLRGIGPFINAAVEWDNRKF